LALIGCGRAAERLWIPAIAAVADVRLAAVVDPRPDRRAEVARQGSAERAFDREDELFARREVDAAIVATPPEAHVATVRAGLRAGIPLLVEKPLATSVADADALADLHRSTATPIMVGFNRRWWEPARRLRDALAGRAAAVRADLVFVAAADCWRPIAGAPDLLDDLASHQFDLLRFCLDTDIRSVTAHHVSADEIAISARLVDGSVARCRIAHAGVSEESVRVGVGGREYRIHASSSRLTPADGTWRRMLDLSDRVWRRAAGIPRPMIGSFEHELRAVVAALRTGAEPTPGVRDGVAAVRAVAAARTSLARDAMEVAVA
jgi:predicted dehydrogenase